MHIFFTLSALSSSQRVFPDECLSCEDNSIQIDTFHHMKVVLWCCIVICFESKISIWNDFLRSLTLASHLNINDCDLCLPCTNISPSYILVGIGPWGHYVLRKWKRLGWLAPPFKVKTASSLLEKILVCLWDSFCLNSEVRGLWCWIKNA